MIVIHCCQYAAPYKGAFINSLQRLEELNYGKIHFVYVFPEDTKETPWINQFMEGHKVFFTKNDVRKSSEALFEIFKNVKPTIVHTHFDGYDIPVIHAKRNYIRETKVDVKLIWHLHNTIEYHSNFVKRFYQFFVFKYHYGLLAKNVNIVSVSKEMALFLNKFGKRSLPTVSTDVFANGVKLPENVSFKFHNDSVVFGAFGGRNVQKRIDLLLEASTNLITKGLKFRVVITKGIDTEVVVNKFFAGKQPKWLTLIDQTDAIGNFFNKINCFISSSVHETFSFAILEATFYNIPVIQSDISGTIWNADRPSTFLFESLNSKQLSEKMEEILLLDQHKISELCLKTKEINSTLYDIDIWCTKIHDVYDKISTK
jgi:glycosyltransferase involved in cell wall biosynthesis